MKVYSILSYVGALKEANLLESYYIHDSTHAISHITYNSKDTREYTLFACKGQAFKKQYLDEAVDNKISCYLSQKKYDTNVELSYIIVTDIRKAMALVADMFYDHAWQKLNLIGITGTKGKTTTAFYIKFILDEYLQSVGQKPCGLLSSVSIFDGIVSEDAHLTTPEAFELHRHFDNAVNSGLSFFVMEVSSQALKYDRVLGVDFNYSIFLNLSKDHISPNEHSDFSDYFSSKLKIFSQSSNAIVSLDTDKAEETLKVSKESCDLTTFSLKDKSADFYGYDIKKVGHEIEFKVLTKAYNQPFKLSMSGLFNVENALAAIVVADKYNIPTKAIENGLYKAHVSGRMEVFSSQSGAVVAIVDYAHNKLSFEKLYSSILEEYKGYRVITVFGCPGDKALNRREELGLLSGKNSDKVYLTADDPSFEKTQDICRDIAQYVACDYEIIEDREEAIKAAILNAPEKSVVIIAGKGHENCQKVEGKLVFGNSDIDCAKQYLSLISV